MCYVCIRRTVDGKEALLRVSYGSTRLAHVQMTIEGVVVMETLIDEQHGAITASNVRIQMRDSKLSKFHLLCCGICSLLRCYAVLRAGLGWAGLSCALRGRATFQTWQV